MKHDEGVPRIAVETVLSALSATGLQIEHDAATSLAAHAGMVLDANRTMNLTRITDAQSVITLHIVDSLAFLPLVHELESPIADIGAGAGYPGVPLAIVGYDVALVESVKKKASFLQHVVDELGLEAQVHPLRAEELAAESPGKYATVVARAVAPLASLVELASPLLRTSGYLVALKGSPSADEVAQADRAAALCGMSPGDLRPYRLPTGETRCVVLYRRAGTPKQRLPRRPGMAQRQPLGGALT